MADDRAIRFAKVRAEIARQIALRPAMAGELQKKLDQVDAIERGETVSMADLLSPGARPQRTPAPPAARPPMPFSFGADQLPTEAAREAQRALMRSPATLQSLGQSGDPGDWDAGTLALRPGGGPPAPLSQRYDPLSAALPGPPGSMDFGRETERARMRSPRISGVQLGERDLAPLPPPPAGSMDFGRERERALASSPFGPQEPLGRDDLAGPPSPFSLRGPIPSSFGAGPGSDAARLPQFRPSFAPGTQERADATTARLPQRPGAGIMPGPVPPNMGSFPPRPPAASLAGDLGGMSPEVAALMGDQASPIAPGLPPSGAPFSPYGPNASPARMPEPRLARIPQARPPQGVSITASPPEEAAPSLPPLSPQAAERARDIPNPAEALSERARPGQRIVGAPGGGPAPPLDPSLAAAAQRAAWGAKPAATRGGFQPTEGFDQALSPGPPAPAPSPQPSAAYPGFDPAATPFARPTGLNLGLGTPANPPGTTEMNPVPNLVNPFNPNQQIVGARSPGFNLMGMQQRMAKPQVPLWDQRAPPAAGTAPGDVTQGADLPAPGPGASLTPQQIQRTMGAQALYNQPPPGMTLPPGVTLPDVGRLGFGDLNADPSKAPVHRYGSNTGKYAGAALGAVKGLAGGPVGVGVGALLGYQGGKRVGGLADRDFGLGARFTNPNYAQGIVANPPAIMGVEPISQPVDIPVTTTGQGGIFGRGLRGLGQKAQGILARVASGGMSIKAAADTLGMSESRIRDSLGSMGSAGGGGMGGGWGGIGGWGGGSSYTGGSYGGNAGGNINQGTGQRFGQR